MKRVEAITQVRVLANKKRSVPETWNSTAEHMRDKKSTKEKESEIYKAIKQKVREQKHKTVVIRSMQHGEHVCSPILFSCVPFLAHVVYINEIDSTLVPMEVYSRDEALLGVVQSTHNRRKKVKYACKHVNIGVTASSSGHMCSNMLRGEGVKVRSIVYVLDRSMEKAKRYIETKKQDKQEKRLAMLYALLECSIKNNEAVLDTESIYMEQTEGDIAYIPVHRKKKVYDEYVLFLVMLVKHTYTVMECAEIMQRVKQNTVAEADGTAVQIMAKMYTAMKDIGWKEKYSKIQKELLMKLV